MSATITNSTAPSNISLLQNSLLQSADEILLASSIKGIVTNNWTTDCARDIARSSISFHWLFYYHFLNRDAQSRFLLSYKPTDSGLASLIVTTNCGPANIFIELGSKEEEHQRSFSNFSSERLQQLLGFLNSDCLNQVSNLGGLFTFAEGSFRSKHTPQWHGHIRVSEELLIAHGTMSKDDMGFGGVFRHLVQHAQNKVVLRRVELNNELSDEITRGYLQLIRKYDTEGHPLNAGHQQIVRSWDGISMSTHKTGNIWVVIWYPRGDESLRPTFVSNKFNFFENPNLPEELSTFGNEMQLFFKEYVDVDETQFRLYGLVKEKEQMNKYYLVANPSRTFTMTKEVGRSSKFTLHGTLLGCPECLQTPPTCSSDSCQFLILVGDDSLSHYFLDALTCPRICNLDALHGNKYFWRDKDVELNIIPDLSAERPPCVLIHPFLPIFAVQGLPGESGDAIFRRVQVIFRNLQECTWVVDVDGTCSSGAEIVFDLEYLRSATVDDAIASESSGMDSLNDKLTECHLSPRILGSFVSGTNHASCRTTIPAYGENYITAVDKDKKPVSFARFERTTAWDGIVAYMWLLPQTFFNCPWLGDKAARDTQLNFFKMNGDKFKVMS